MQREFLTKPLGQRIGILRPHDGRFRRRVGIGYAVAGRRGGVDEAFDLGRARNLKNVEGAVHVGPEIAVGVLDRRHDVRERRQVNHPIRALERRRPWPGHADIRLHKRDAPGHVREVFRPASAVVVDDHHLMALAQQ